VTRGLPTDAGVDDGGTAQVLGHTEDEGRAIGDTDLQAEQLLGPGVLQTRDIRLHHNDLGLGSHAAESAGRRAIAGRDAGHVRAVTVVVDVGDRTISPQRRLDLLSRPQRAVVVPGGRGAGRIGLVPDGQDAALRRIQRIAEVPVPEVDSSVEDADDHPFAGETTNVSL